MSLDPINVASAYPHTGYSLPDMVSFCVQDADGAGGSLYLDGLGVVDGNDIFDIKTLFTAAGVNFVSYPLLRAFRAVPAATGNASALAQLSKNLEINSYPIEPSAAGPAVSLRFAPITGIGGTTGVPFLWIVAQVSTDPDYAGDIWRLELKLRHSITN